MSTAVAWLGFYILCCVFPLQDRVTKELDMCRLIWEMRGDLPLPQWGSCLTSPHPHCPRTEGVEVKILFFFITCFVFCKLQIGVTIHKAVMTAVRVEWDMNDLGAQWSFDYCRCLQMEDLAEEDTTRAVGATWMEGLLKASVSPVRTGDTRWLELQSIEVLNVEKWNQSHFFNK